MIEESRSSCVEDKKFLVSTETARAVDKEAQEKWGFNEFALIEAAGRLCAGSVIKAITPQMYRPKITVVTGTGNNGADAMVMLRYWILSCFVDASSSSLIISRVPNENDKGPWVEILKSLEKMNVKIIVYNDDKLKVINDILSQSDIIIDGIAGTGISGPLKGQSREILKAINSLQNNEKNSPLSAPNFPFPFKPLIVSVDVPSGNSDEWKPGMPIIKADITLAIEPQKLCLYTPASRPFAGNIIPVEGIFPKELINCNTNAELLDWKNACKRITKIKKDTYKNERGVVEIRAGFTGTTGAALIAARGAQAAGAGLVRLVVDDDIYPILAPFANGIMVSPVSSEQGVRWKPDVMLLGPGWGTTPNRRMVFENALLKEKAGTPLILDADAIELSKKIVFNGNTILTPHPGELSKLTGIEKEKILSQPAEILAEISRRFNATILLKSHVLFISAPDSRLGIVDGMSPGLATGGSGDLLAGICAAIAARMTREAAGVDAAGFDAFTCAAVAASLLVSSGSSDDLNRRRFNDPLETANITANLAGEAWL